MVACLIGALAMFTMATAKPARPAHATEWFELVTTTSTKLTLVSFDL